MYYLAEITDYDTLVIKDSENSEFCEVFNDTYEVWNKFEDIVLGVGFNKRRVVTKAELLLLKWVDTSDYSWEQKIVDYSTVPSHELLIVDNGFNFKNDRPIAFEDANIVTLPTLIIRYLAQSLNSNFIYAIGDKLYVLADFERIEDSNSCVCEYRVYNIKDRTKFDIAITKAVILCK